jgi:nucleoside phosphorylase
MFQDRMGMVDCAILVARAVRVFRPAIVAMTGVCAGRSKASVRLCDLVVPSQIFTYDTGKHGEQGFQPEPLSVEVADSITRRVVAIGNSIIQRISSEIEATSAEDVYKPKIHTQVMACGSAVVDHEDIIKMIGDANRKVVGLDMESYAVLRAVKLCSPTTPTFVVKGVMDLGRRKRDVFKRKAAFWAASFLARFIAQEFESLLHS